MKIFNKTTKTHQAKTHQVKTSKATNHDEIREGMLFQPDESSSPEDYAAYCQFYGLSPITLNDLDSMIPPSLRHV